MRRLTSLSVDKILLPRYLNWSTNFRGLEMAPSCLKHMNSVLSTSALRPMLRCSRLCSWGSVMAGIFVSWQYNFLLSLHYETKIFQRENGIQLMQVKTAPDLYSSVGSLGDWCSNLVTSCIRVLMLNCLSPWPIALLTLKSPVSPSIYP